MDLKNGCDAQDCICLRFLFPIFYFDLRRMYDDLNCLCFFFPYGDFVQVHDIFGIPRSVACFPLSLVGPSGLHWDMFVI